MNSDDGVGPGFGEQIGHTELAGPLIEVGFVEFPGLHAQDAEDVTPLAVRDFAAEAEPFEFVKQNVFGRNCRDRSAIHLHVVANDLSQQETLIEGPQLLDEHIHFETGRCVNDVE